ncbi:Hypothetical protein D9617_3g018160 [Elsinoe fawcettii]|nr:Hypothetical protein D9617_3g018160 [Elsinoe fawcettii]
MHLTLRLTTDLICPWCYIGSTQLHRALSSFLSSHPNTTYSLTHHPFQLDPSLPIPGVPKTAYLESHLGPRRAAAREGVLAAAVKAGIKLNPDDEGATVGNTLAGHRLVWWAGGAYLAAHKARGIEADEGKARQTLQERLVERLHVAYFEQNEDVSDVKTLVDAAEEAGMEREATETFLRSSEGEKEVKGEIGQAVAKGVRGVPYMEVNGYPVQGGIGEEGWLKVFERLRELDEGK